MKGRYVIFSILLILVLAVLWALKTSAPKHIVPGAPWAAPAIPADAVTERDAIVSRVQGALSTPIAFFGRVIDQNGEPVPDATINFTALGDC